jgi:hypothetical protein
VPPLGSSQQTSADDAQAIKTIAVLNALANEKPVVLSVPYGEHPLGRTTLEEIRVLFSRLGQQKYRGLVDIRSFPGKFCLIGNATEGYSLAPDESLYANCDAVGNPQASQFAQSEPLSFVNLVGELRNNTAGAADAEVASGNPLALLVPYPQVSRSLSAGEWNRAASLNNRIEVRLR